MRYNVYSFYHVTRLYNRNDQTLFCLKRRLFNSITGVSVKLRRLESAQFALM